MNNEPWPNFKHFSSKMIHIINNSDSHDDVSEIANLMDKSNQECNQSNYEKMLNSMPDLPDKFTNYINQSENENTELKRYLGMGYSILDQGKGPQILID